VAARVEDAIAAWWAARADLRAMTSDGRLWHAEAPEGVGLPYATYDVTAQPERPGRTTGYYLLDAEATFAAHAATDAQASAIRRAIRDAIDEAVLTVEGGPSWACRPGDQWVGIANGLGPEGSDCWRATVNVSITTQRNP
jgi:hypothetical protein